MALTTFTFSSNDGKYLLGRLWVTRLKKPKGIVHLIHGLGEHSGRYDHIGKALTKTGYHLAAFDLRGHGLSQGQRGHIPDFDHLIDDVKLFLRETKNQIGNTLPTFLYGHSLGGNIVLALELQYDTHQTGIIVTSPCLETTSPPPKIKVSLAKHMSRIMPTFSLKNGLETAALSRNNAVVKAYKDDVYVHNILSAQLGMAIIESGQYVLNSAPRWTKPLLLMHGTADRITSPIASQRFAENAGTDVNLILWEDYYHELHNDFGSDVVINEMISWLDAISLN